MLRFEPAEECKDGKPQHIAGTTGQAGENSIQSSAPARGGGGALLLFYAFHLALTWSVVVSLWLWGSPKIMFDTLVGIHDCVFKW